MLVAGAASPSLTGNVVEDVRQLFGYPFMVNAFRAGTIVAVLAGVIGWFMVLRKQSFAGHTLAVVGFPGAAGATLLGIGALYGYFTFCVAAAVGIALLPSARGRGFSEENAITGTIGAFFLACGFLFISLYKGFLEGVNSLLFGSFLGITNQQVVVLAVVAAVGLGAMALMGRPLLFASIDGDVAQARGVPVRALGVAFLILLGMAAAEASQITGSLLVFALLVMPPATAQRLTTRPVSSLALTVGIGLLVTWLGLAAAYYSPYPIGFWVTTFAFAAYLLSHLAGAALLRRRAAVVAPSVARADVPSGADR
ncbi:MAG TPA: iron chelate uptake ABC transporter family permease subunit [Acidimicrobiales bacterium]